MCADVQEADVAVVGLLTDDFDDTRFATSRAILRTSLTLVTSRRRRHQLTLDDVTDDVSTTPVVVARSRVERLIRRSRRALWRRINGGRTSTGRGRSSSSRVESVDAGVRRVLNATEDFVLIVESTDAAYATSRPPGCTLTVARQRMPVAEFRFVVASSSSSSSRQRGLLRRLDSSVAELQQAAVVKRVYYKWWTSTDCLAHITDPDVWTPAVDRDDAATDVDETSDDERIFFRSPLAERARDRRPSAPVDDDRGGTSQQLGEARDVDRRRLGGAAAAGCADDDDCWTHTTTTTTSDRTSSGTTTTAGTSSPSHTTTTTTTTMELPLRSHVVEEVDAAERHALSVEENARFEWTFVTRSKSTDDEPVDVTLDVVTASVSDELSSGRETAIKDHWHSGGAVDRPSMTVVRQASDRDGQSAAATDRGRVVSPLTSVMLLMVVAVLLRTSNIRTMT